MCPETRAPLSDDVAFTVLEPFFVETRALFVEAGLRRCEKTRLEIDPGAHDTPRHMAGCTEDGLVIVAAPELAELPVDNVVAIFAHEFGHAGDFLYPTRFVVADGELVTAVERERASLDDMDQRGSYNRRRQWEARDAHEVEIAADFIAAHVTGRVIRYGGPCMLQTYGPGKRRPRSLR